MRALLFAVVAATVGCSKPPQPPPAEQGSKPQIEQVERAEQAEQPAAPPPLSEEDQRLIAADPKDLTPEMRRKRAYALRRKAMQDPNSPLARTLTDLQKAYENGELEGIEPGTTKPTFTVDGKPASGEGTKPMGPAGARTEGE